MNDKRLRNLRLDEQMWSGHASTAKARLRERWHTVESVELSRKDLAEAERQLVRIRAEIATLTN
jgi:hypothetical protein